MVSLTKKFSEFVNNAKVEDFNEEMIFFTRMSMLDWAGVAYAGRKEPVSQIVTKLVEDDRLNRNNISNKQAESFANFFNGEIIELESKE